MGYYCNSCEKTIDNDTARFSKKKFKWYLCGQHQPTPEAWRLINCLTEHEWDVNFEEPDGYKCVDIVLKDIRLIIEVDGGYHDHQSQKVRDRRRDYFSKKDGFETHHVKNADLQTDESTEEYYEKELEQILNERQEEIDDEDSEEDEDY